MPSLMMLSKDNFDSWELAVANVFYAEGWSDLYDASKVDPPANGHRADDNALPQAARRLAWGTITSSLPANMLLTVSRVQLGEVEALIRQLRSLTYRSSAATRNSLKTQLFQTKLDNHSDLEAYMTHIENLVSSSQPRLQSLGRRQALSPTSWPPRRL